MKRQKILFLTALLTIVLSSIVFAALEGGDARRGKQLAIDSCKPCHVQGATAGTVTPLSRTQRQWERFYNKSRHEKIAPGTWKMFTEQDLKDVFQFMYNHAADSDQPMTCGQ